MVSQPLTKLRVTDECVGLYLFNRIRYRVLMLGEIGVGTSNDCLGHGYSTSAKSGTKRNERHCDEIVYARSV